MFKVMMLSWHKHNFSVEMWTQFTFSDILWAPHVPEWPRSAVTLPPPPSRHSPPLPVVMHLTVKMTGAVRVSNMNSVASLLLTTFFLVLLGEYRTQKLLVNYSMIKIRQETLLFISAGRGPPVESKILTGRRYESPFSVEELLNLVIPKKQSKDVDMDPCKSEVFIGKCCNTAAILSSLSQETSPIPKEQTPPRRQSDDFVTISMWETLSVSQG